MKREVLNIVTHGKHDMNILQITFILTQPFSLGTYILLFPFLSFLFIKYSNFIFHEIKL